MSDVSAERVEIITETMVLPTGCPLDDPEWHSWAVFVRWVTKGWAVTTVFHHERLSRAGKWSHYVPKFKRHQYMFETREEALNWAYKVVDERKVNYRTYSEWQEKRASEK